jgi:phosphoribosyl-AMP cyclohydrolase
MEIDFAKQGGLVPAIVQDAASGDVLMLAYMNAEAYRATKSSGKATYFSRSRQKLWVKGETSGNVQTVVEIRVDCDRDTVLLRVKQAGAACHTGYPSCFFRRITPEGEQRIGTPLFDPKEVYGE